MLITSHQHVQELRAQIIQSIEVARAAVASSEKSSLPWLTELRFGKLGIHPLSAHPLNFIEQINQTFTYLVALAGVRVLLDRHPEANGFLIAPGAHASLPLDIMSKEPELVGAECFAAVEPTNNNKLNRDMAKLRERSERYRYVFFSSPRHQRTERVEALCEQEVDVWSVDLK